jgi:hypothetical protein
VFFVGWTSGSVLGTFEAKLSGIVQGQGYGSENQLGNRSAGHALFHDFDSGTWGTSLELLHHVQHRAIVLLHLHCIPATVSFLKLARFHGEAR